MFNSFQQINDLSHIMNEKFDIYNKIITFHKKFTPFLIGIVLDTNESVLVNTRGFGYELFSSSSASTTNDYESLSSLRNLSNRMYPFVFSYPQQYAELDERHLKNMVNLMSNQESENKVKYAFDQVLDREIKKKNCLLDC